jgi:drug/metabolite transporter (DMT)-like permease
VAIQRTGIAYASLIVGLLPVTTTLAADWLHRRADARPFDAHRLLAPLAVIALGVAAVNADLFLRAPTSARSGTAALFVGIVSAFLALFAWTVYAVHNASYVRAHPRLGVGEWATLQGLGTLGWVLVTWGAWSAFGSLGWTTAPQPIAALRDPAFLGWILFLGIGASWLGTALWNYGSRSLAPTLSGQMIVFETVFGLLYGFVFEARLPHPLEAIGIVLLLAGVVWAVRAHG